MTNDRFTGLAFIIAILVSFGAIAMDNAEAKQAKPIKTRVHIVCSPAPCRK